MKLNTRILVKIKNGVVYYYCDDFVDIMETVVTGVKHETFSSGVLVWIENSWVCPKCFAINSNEGTICIKCSRR